MAQLKKPKSLYDLLREDRALEEKWKDQGKEVLEQLCRREGLDLTGEYLTEFFSQACDLAKSELFFEDLDETERIVANFWSKVEKGGVLLSQCDYLRASVVALSFFHRFAKTDFGSSRQRSFGQAWADATQGILGEIAFQKVIKATTDGRLVPILDAKEEELDVALSADVIRVLFNKQPHEPKKKVSIKTTKMNGRWLDVPYAQRKHSDVYVLVKIGTNPNTFFKFLAEAGAIRRILAIYTKSIKDEVFEAENNAYEKARRTVKELEKSSLFTIAIVAGWQEKASLNRPFLASKSNAIRARSTVTIYSGIGTIPSASKGGLTTDQIDFPDSIKEAIGGKPNGLKISFHPIGSFSKAEHALSSTDLLNSDLEPLIEFLYPEVP
ncbi:hypothetical protein TthSNM66_24240 (plasmid) [Thermus thermophilus]|uniref:hypothetical protein n=1 Tax=Thermus thermophilus TaxID=274 RepID=UPI001FCA5C85|nr:hypothetical protein [Thermus thermophilus]BDG27788.1 hypothetical protein TthSNM66_24240 [Thermus thermophilus]